MSNTPEFKDQIDTPALCVDLDAMEFNIGEVVAACREHNVGWRPHAKCHKSPIIGHKLIEAGAMGLTCAKLGEAEVFGAAGIQDLLIANLIVGPIKLARLVQLRQIADPIVCIDHPRQAESLDDAVKRHGSSLPVRVLVELDIGLQRVGVLPGQPALELAQFVDRLPGLQLAGIMGYEGHLLTLPDPVEKAEKIHAALDLLQSTAQQIRDAGLSCEIVSCGGTGSLKYSVTHPGITEVQAGGAIFMDEFYRNCCQVEGLKFALTVLTTVVSRPTADRAIIDAGRKTTNPNHHMPRILRDGLTVDSLSAEHGTLKVGKEAGELPIGERLELVPGYGDLTTVLHDRFYATRGDRVEAVWPLEGRGKLQ